MDRYLVHGQNGTQPLNDPELSSQLHAPASIMADGEAPATTPANLTVSMPPSTPNQLPPEEQYAALAQAVASLLTPTITAAVDNAMALGLAKFSRELGEQVKRVSDLEKRVSDLEEEVQSLYQTNTQLREAQQVIFDKLDDLENRSRRNNLRVIGLPETITPDNLTEICAVKIPQALGLPSQCTVERAHRLGPPSNDRRLPRPVIVRYLNYADRTHILQSYRNSKSLQIQGNKLLLFADYSPEVSKRWKAFQPMCSALYHKGLKFALAYPATLRLTDPLGETKSFTNPEEAGHYLETYLHLPMDTTPSPNATRPTAPRDQRSPRKDPAKKLRLTDKSHRGKWR